MIEILRWTVVIIGTLLAGGALMRWRTLPASSRERQLASGQVSLGVALVLLMLSSLLDLREPWETGMILLALAFLVLAIVNNRRGNNNR